MDTLMTAITVGVREAKVNLSRLLKQVREGIQVVITDRGQPVGRIVPIGNEELSLEERLKDLEKRGILRAKEAANHVKVPRPLQMSKKADLQGMLQEDRARL
ncbi:MAG: type II toxin-antitoxin system Phd/YefM family antitoxin [Deltaproteobacteria bacterium]